MKVKEDNKHGVTLGLGSSVDSVVYISNEVLRKNLFMNEWEAVHDARTSLQALSNEMTLRRKNWTYVKGGWGEAKAFVEPTCHNRPPEPESYLNHVMAEEFVSSEFPQKCLFKASRDLMLRSSSSHSSDPGMVLGTTLGHDLPIEKFSTDLAWLNERNHSVRNMTEFSRFLFQLSGENELASAGDPLRKPDSTIQFPHTSNTEHDRLIR